MSNEDHAKKKRHAKPYPIITINVMNLTAIILAYSFWKTTFKKKCLNETHCR